MGETLRYRGRTSVAKTTQVAPIRCAVYCRKSTSQGLDQEFNSLDAQREAAEAYIESQRHENWLALPDRYDDGGYSGGTVLRPGLKRMLADIEAGQIGCVIVYKYDRLSRSMLDFLQLLDFFKRHGVSFVSVSQRFDTSTPVGEMTLNMLLSFAQFERQIIAERTRDKIHAARRHGRWTGGRPPLGYDVAPEGGRLIVNKDEAERVKSIFELYIEHRSLTRVTDELNRRGWTRKSWTTRTGTYCVGGKWDAQTVRRLLIDPLYLGKQKLGDEVFPGEHKGIIQKRTFDRVQRLLAENRSTGGGAVRNTSGALLRGLLRCVACDRSMFHTTGKKKGRAYRYYRCPGSDCPTKPVRADQIETFIVNEIRRIGADPKLQAETFRQAVQQIKAQRRGLKREAKQLERDLVKARAEVERLVATLPTTPGLAGDAVRGELERAQERVAKLDARLAEVSDEMASLAKQTVDESELARALEAFDPIWDVLLTPEKERVLQLLIERIDYEGGSGQLSIRWRLAGFGTLAEEVAP